MKRCFAMLLTLICILVFVGCSQKNKLTLDKVVELSSKGDELTWSDFEQYECVVTGSGLYILVYDIDDVFELRIGGDINQEYPPTYIILLTKADRGNHIDIRTDNVQKFIEENQK